MMDRTYSLNLVSVTASNPNGSFKAVDNIVHRTLVALPLQIVAAFVPKYPILEGEAKL